MSASPKILSGANEFSERGPWRQARTRTNGRKLVAELVEDGVSGFLVHPGDVGTLADRLETLLSDARLRTEFGRAGRARVEQGFDLNQESKRLLRVLLDSLEGRVAPIRPEVDEGDDDPCESNVAGSAECPDLVE